MADAKETAQAEGATETLDANAFSSLLEQEFKPKSDRAREAVSGAVATLAERALSESAVISSDVIETISAMIAEIDHKLTEQVNLIMHHEDFQQLESAWRGLHHLVNNTESDEQLKIKVFNISKKELGQNPEEVQGNGLGSEPDLQESI